MSPTLCSQVGANVVLRALSPADGSTEQLDIVIDFPNGEVREHAGEPFAFRFDIDRRLVETVVAQRAVDTCAAPGCCSSTRPAAHDVVERAAVVQGTRSRVVSLAGGGKTADKHGCLIEGDKR